MHKNKVLWIVLAVIILAGAGWWYYNSSNQQQTSVNGSSVTTQLSSPTLSDTGKNTELMISNKTQDNSRVDFSDWKIESKSTGLTYTIPAAIKPVTFAADYVSIKLNGSPSDNNKHEAEGVSYRLFTGAATWNVTHDTITLRDPSDNIKDTLSY